jgi:hypothetical protein
VRYRKVVGGGPAQPRAIQEGKSLFAQLGNAVADRISVHPIPSCCQRSFDAPVAACAGAVHDSVRTRLFDWYESACRALAVVRAGPSALQACAAETGLHRHTLRRWAFAASRLDRADMESLASWRDSSGRAPSVWHIIELARLSRPHRALILHEMRVGLWPVVKLRKIEKNKKHHRGSSDSR